MKSGCDPKRVSLDRRACVLALKEGHLGQAFPDRTENGLETAGDLEFPEDAAQMSFHCFLTDEEVLGDFFIGAACGEEMEDLPLPGS